MKTLLAALLLFIAPAAALAQADDADCHAPVAAEHRCRNLTGVQCAWASLRSMALRAGQSRLAAVCASKHGPMMSPREIETACRECGVAVERVGPGDRERLFDFLEKHVANEKRPCWIGVQGGAHAVLCVHFERGRRVKLLGNSQTPWVFELPWDQFLAYGPDGLAFALPGDKGSPTKPAAVPAPTVPCPDGSCPADVASPPRPAGDGWEWGHVPGVGMCWSRVVK